MKNSDEMRVQFEAAYEAKSFERNGRFDRAVLTRGGDDEYVMPQVQSAWWGWQTSLEILRVTNPFPVQMGDPDADWARGVADQSLRSQGLRGSVDEDARPSIQEGRGRAGQVPFLPWESGHSGPVSRTAMRALQRLGLGSGCNRRGPGPG